MATTMTFEEILKAEGIGAATNQVIIDFKGDNYDGLMLDELVKLAELYCLKERKRFLIGKKVRYRYYDWEEGSYSPWATCNESDLKKIFEDNSIESVEFKP